MDQKAKIIGIGGVSCSGKTFLANELSQMLGRRGLRVSVIDQDDYVFPSAEIPLVKGHTDWECPESIDFDGFRKAIKDASSDNDFVLAGGLMAFWEPSVSDLFDIMIFIRLTKDEFKRRKRKDLRWGKEPDWYIDHIWDSYLQYGQLPEGLQPDIILDGNEAFDSDQIYQKILAEMND